jgi:Skp family chaperone for outer membrane proteins
MNLNIKRILPGCILVFLLASQAMAQNRIATVDLTKVFDKYWKREQAEAALKVREDELSKELKSLGDDYTKLKDDYLKLRDAINDPTLTTVERDKRKATADSKLLELKNREDDIRTMEGNDREELDLKTQRLRETLLKDITAAVNAKAKSAGYFLVIDKTAESFNKLHTPIVLYSNGENDITDEVLKQLNAAAPAPTTPTDAPKTTDSDKGSKK